MYFRQTSDTIADTVDSIFDPRVYIRRNSADLHAVLSCAAAVRRGKSHVTCIAHL